MSNLNSLFDQYGALVFFDTETTGLNPQSCQIIELAVLRVTQFSSGHPHIDSQYDTFVSLPRGERLPEKIVQLTGVTDYDLVSQGVSGLEAGETFLDMIRPDEDCLPTLMIAHNARFDISFVDAMLNRYGIYDPVVTNTDFLDTLSVFRSLRKGLPHHRLCDAILAYNLEGKVQNTHRAIDDVLALYEVTKAMDEECPNLNAYVCKKVSYATMRRRA